MATDYDAPRRGVEVLDTEAEVSLITRPTRSRPKGNDVDAPDAVEAIDLPGADLSGEELVVVVEPMRAHEFRCARCYLVQSRHLVAAEARGGAICRDCAA
jgi:hypothetical protein